MTQISKTFARQKFVELAGKFGVTFGGDFGS